MQGNVDEEEFLDTIISGDCYEWFHAKPKDKNTTRIVANVYVPSWKAEILYHSGRWINFKSRLKDRIHVDAHRWISLKNFNKLPMRVAPSRNSHSNVSSEEMVEVDASILKPEIAANNEDILAVAPPPPPPLAVPVEVPNPLSASSSSTTTSSSASSAPSTASNSGTAASTPAENGSASTTVENDDSTVVDMASSKGNTASTSTRIIASATENAADFGSSAGDIASVSSKGNTASTSTGIIASAMENAVVGDIASVSAEMTMVDVLEGNIALASEEMTASASSASLKGNTASTSTGIIASAMETAVLGDIVLSAGDIASVTAEITVVENDVLKGNIASTSQAFASASEGMTASTSSGIAGTSGDNQTTSQSSPPTKVTTPSRDLPAPSGQKAPMENGDKPRRQSSRLQGRKRKLDQVEEDEESVCPICLDTFSAMAKLKTLPCHHEFHKECLFTWVRQGNGNGDCPLCRQCIQCEGKRCEIILRFFDEEPMGHDRYYYHPLYHL